MDTRLSHQCDPAIKITGKSLAQRIPHLTPTGRAILGYDFLVGNFELAQHTLNQAAWLAHSNSSYVAALARATEHEREAVRRGQAKITALLRNTPMPSSNVARVIQRVGVDQLIGQIGIDEVWAALDRATMPDTMIAAE